MKEVPGRDFGFVCEKHAPVAGKFAGQEPKAFIGKYVKLAFPVKDPRPGGKVDTEHMWVKVESIYEGPEKEDLVGTLNNDPFFPCQYQCGDQVAFSVSEIEQVQES